MLLKRLPLEGEPRCPLHQRLGCDPQGERRGKQRIIPPGMSHSRSSEGLETSKKAPEIFGDTEHPAVGESHGRDEPTRATVARASRHVQLQPCRLAGGGKTRFHLFVGKSRRPGGRSHAGPGRWRQQPGVLGHYLSCIYYLNSISLQFWKERSHPAVPKARRSSPGG